MVIDGESAMTEQKQTAKEADETKEVITYMSVEEEGISVEQLADDPEKLSIGDGRWVIDIPKKFAICLSEEFEQAAVSCTQHNKDEWGGFIVGHDIKWTNPENNRQIRILVAERIVILGQTRSGASFEIKADVVEKWMDSDAEEAMSFKTVYAKNRWKKIGWVHSHASLGVFWSTTDTDTMEDMRGIPLVLSIVYSRVADKKIDRQIRVDQNDTFFGGKFNMNKDCIEDLFVYNEGNVETIEDVSEEIQEAYKKILADTVVIATTSHMTAKTRASTIDRRSLYQQAFYNQTMPGPRNTTQQLSKHTVIIGNLSEKAKDEIVTFGNFHYGLSQKDRKSLSIADLFILLDDELADQMRPEGLYKKWKMKDVVPLLDKHQIFKVISFYKSSEISVQLALQAYHNFRGFSVSLIKLLKERLVKDSKLEAEVVDIAGEDWDLKMEAALVEKEEIKLDIGDVEKVVEESKPVPYMPNEKFTDWTDWYNFLPKKYQEDLWDTLFNTLDDERRKKMLERVGDAITTELRGDEDDWLVYASSTYENLVDMWNETPKRYKERYRNFYTSFYRAAFKSYFSEYKYYNEKHSKLQRLLNAIPEDYLKQFINDFIFSYETKEEFEEIITKYSDDYKVYKQTFACGLCGIEWSLKADAESCEEACKKRGKTKSKEVAEIVVKSGVKKEMKPVEEKSLASLFAGRTFTDDGVKRTISNDVIFGTPIEYYRRRDVCSLCGTLCITEEAAELCETACTELLEDVKQYFIDKDGMYECSYCEIQFFDDALALLHGTRCQEFGVMLGYMLYLLSDSGLTTAQIYKSITEFYKDKQGSPPPIIEWLLGKQVGEKDLFKCDVCGAEHVENKDMRSRLVQAFAHMKYCNVENKEELIVWNGAAYYCNVCTEYTFSTTTPEMMQVHFFTKHGMYPTKEQIVNSHKSIPLLGQGEYVGETNHAILLVDGFCCKECGDKYISPDNFMYHMGREHSRTILPGEFDVWVEHDKNVEMMIFGTPTYSEALERGDPKELIVTENVNSYNGIFVCRICDLTVSTIEEMKKHLLGVHEIYMSPGEELSMSDYEVRYNKQLVESVPYEEGVFESLDDLFLSWLTDRAMSKSSQTICEKCGAEFIGLDSDTKNIWQCFIHEMDCCELTSTGTVPYVCGLCGTIHKTIFERQLCEEGHINDE